MYVCVLKLLKSLSARTWSLCPEAWRSICPRCCAELFLFFLFYFVMCEKFYIFGILMSMAVYISYCVCVCVCDSSIWMMKCIQMQVPFLTSVICHSFFFDFHQLDSRMALIYRTLSTFVCVCVNSVYLILHFICNFLIFQSPFCWTFLFAIVWNSIWFNLYLLSAA